MQQNMYLVGTCLVETSFDADLLKTFVYMDLCLCLDKPLQVWGVSDKCFMYFSMKTYVVVTH